MDTLTASRWDDEYRTQRYANEPPLPFVDRILETLRADDSAGHGTGLYVGCGNGRNYLPLVDAGLELFGLDVSPEAIKQLLQRRPALPAQRLLCEDFRSEEHTSELQSPCNLVCRLLLEKKKKNTAPRLAPHSSSLLILP